MAAVIFAVFAILFGLCAIRQTFVDDEVHWKEGMI